jgi:GH24 family phage-related lysozyme (muramidase)
MPDLTISDAAINLIVSAEVTSEAFYTKRYQRPTWPGEASGVTIGIGYDCGYVTEAELRRDWGGLLAPAAIDALIAVALGVHGDRAEGRTAQLQDIIVPWSAAMTEFRRSELPKWIARTSAALPNTGQLHPDCLGALVSLTYNRGTSYDLRGARYAEMRAIKQHMGAITFDRIPGDIRSMIRLWPRTKGLRLRREAEAKLFEQGLRNA